MLSISIIVFLITGLLIFYHHLGYPIFLALMNKKKRYLLPYIDERSYKDSIADEYLPEFSILIPAYNEEAYIQQKIYNLASIDYPSSKFDIQIICDGCNDNTYEKAMEAKNNILCENLNLTIDNCDKNRGKVSVLNEYIPKANNSLVVLSDVSSLLPVDTLLSLAAHFSVQDIGAVSNAYCFIEDGMSGEKSYWNYQVKVKMCEHNLGNVLGAHGSCYAISKECFEPLRSNTINDDFVIPMKIAGKGYRVTYEPRVASIELEKATMDIDHSRRKRIAAGNLQQVLILWKMLLPHKGWLAFNFFSGKFLRVLMPYCFILFFLSSLGLANFYFIGILISLVQILLYSFVFLYEYKIVKCESKILSTLHYFFMGHFASLKGSLNYIFKQQCAWNNKAEESL
jgi:cellulose synthase/poly-beta-1,6-N-acetylglucosamine synthase-like glycosyltransferase